MQSLTHTCPKGSARAVSSSQSTEKTQTACTAVAREFWTIAAIPSFWAFQHFIETVLAVITTRANTPRLGEAPDNADPQKHGKSWTMVAQCK